MDEMNGVYNSRVRKRDGNGNAQKADMERPRFIMQGRETALHQSRRLFVPREVFVFNPGACQVAQTRRAKDSQIQF
jgi:hypothetical protein